MFSSLIVWKKFLKFEAGANDTKKALKTVGSSLKEWLTSQFVQIEQISVTRHRLLRSESPDEDVLSILTAENREGSSCPVINEVAKVPRSMRRQVPMIQEMQKDQKPEKVQISFQSVRR